MIAWDLEKKNLSYTDISVYEQRFQRQYSMKYLKVENTMRYQAYWRGDPVPPEDGSSPIAILSLS